MQTFQTSKLLHLNGAYGRKDRNIQSSKGPFESCIACLLFVKDSAELRNTIMRDLRLVRARLSDQLTAGLNAGYCLFAFDILESKQHRAKSSTCVF